MTGSRSPDWDRTGRVGPTKRKGLNGNRRFSPARFRNLVAYLIEKHDGEIETSRLCWLLFRIDMEAYRKLGRSVTGCVYVKGSDGYPIPCRRSKPRPSRTKPRPA